MQEWYSLFKKLRVERVKVIYQSKFPVFGYQGDGIRQFDFSQYFPRKTFCVYLLFSFDHTKPEFRNNNK